MLPRFAPPLFALVTSVSVLLNASPARADGDEVEATVVAPTSGAPSRAPELPSPVAPPAAPTAPVAASAAEGTPLVAVAGTCVLGEHDGVPEPDARTSARLVCDEIARESAGAWTGTYRVSMSRLGTNIILSVRADGVNGGTVRLRTLRLGRIEEAALAAPRLAEAIVRDIPIEETEKVGNLTGGETARIQKKPGEFKLGIGVGGVLLSTADTTASALLLVRAHYETPRFAVGGEMRVSTNAPMPYFGLGVGGRYFTSDADVSPFFGGGLALVALDSYDSKSGLAAYGELGLQMLRTHRARFTLDLRVDAPTFATGSSTNPNAYVVPVSMAAGVAW